MKYIIELHISHRECNLQDYVSYLQSYISLIINHHWSLFLWFVQQFKQDQHFMLLTIRSHIRQSEVGKTRPTIFYFTNDHIMRVPNRKGSYVLKPNHLTFETTSIWSYFMPS